MTVFKLIKSPLNPELTFEEMNPSTGSGGASLDGCESFEVTVKKKKTPFAP